ncbi:MAG: hypothetical protein Q9160_003370 [Pyrenula sp. 1 TL-2023]
MKSTVFGILNETFFVDSFQPLIETFCSDPVFLYSKDDPKTTYIPIENDSQFFRSQREWFYATVCTIKANWASASINYNFSTQATTFEIDEKTVMDGKGAPISIAADWAAKLTKVWRESEPANRMTSFIHYAGIVLAIGISETAQFPGICNDAFAGESWYKMNSAVPDKQCLTEQQNTSITKYVEESGLGKQYDSVLFSTETDWSDPNDLTQLVILGYTHGYGYSSSDVIIQLSLIVILLYCLIATVYLLYTFVTGYTASSWDSVSELLVLGVHSRTPAHLENTSVGIDTISPFREPVSIRVNENDSAELVFENDTSLRKRQLRDVVPNGAY